MKQTEKRVMVTFRFPKLLLKSLKAEAKTEDRTLTSLVINRCRKNEEEVEDLSLQNFQNVERQTPQKLVCIQVKEKSYVKAKSRRSKESRTHKA